MDLNSEIIFYSLTENLIYNYLNPNNDCENSLNNSADSYEKVFGIKIQNELINGINISNIFPNSEGSPNSSLEFSQELNVTNNNFNNVEEIDNYYEDRFDDETIVIHIDEEDNTNNDID